jgi:hypothetical protein
MISQFSLAGISVALFHGDSQFPLAGISVLLTQLLSISPQGRSLLVRRKICGATGFWVAVVVARKELFLLGLDNFSFRVSENGE